MRSYTSWLGGFGSVAVICTSLGRNVCSGIGKDKVMEKCGLTGSRALSLFYNVGWKIL